MKLTLWHASASGKLKLEKRDPLSPWTVTLPDGSTTTARGSRAVAVAKAEQILAGNSQPTQKPVAPRSTT